MHMRPCSNILQHWAETTQATKDNASAFMAQFDAGAYVQPTGQSSTVQQSGHVVAEEDPEETSRISR
jgi:hypothetical protein